MKNEQMGETKTVHILTACTLCIMEAGTEHNRSDMNVFVLREIQTPASKQSMPSRAVSSRIPRQSREKDMITWTLLVGCFKKIHIMRRSFKALDHAKASMRLKVLLNSQGTQEQGRGFCEEMKSLSNR